MLSHHPVFSHFKEVTSEIPEGFELDSYLGTKRRLLFLSRFKPPTNLDAYPRFDEEYFEWIDLLQSVVAAQRSYTMIELGAGFGRWAVRAAHALRQYNSGIPCRLIAVEGEPAHFEWMRLHFDDNEIDPAGHSLLHAAVSDTPGTVSFDITMPDGAYQPDGWYGQSLSRNDDVVQEESANNGVRSIHLPSVSLTGILQDLPLVDLIDFDVQGAEGRAIRSAIGALDARVKRLHVGTHSKEIENDLRELLSAHGWQCQADYSLGSTSETPWGAMQFQDGVQSWVNPGLSGPGDR